MKPRSRAFGPAGDGSAPEALLEAARQVFSERGFSGARADDAMRRAAAGPGAGRPGPVRMDELFVALWQRHEASHADAVRQAVSQARGSGVTDPAALFEAGSRAYLQGSWLRRDLALLFSAADGPAQLTAIRQHRQRVWRHRNAVVLGLADNPEDRLHTAVVTTLMGRGAREVAVAADFRQAQAVTDAVVGYARLLLAAYPVVSNRPARRSVGPGGRTRP